MKTIYRIRAKKANYFFTQNEDGSLNVTRWGEAIGNAGQIINALGGIEAMMNKAEATDFESFEQVAEMRKAEMEKQQVLACAHATAKNAGISKAYEALKSQGTIPVTIDNLRVVMAFLNSQNWGSWELPKMSIGYSANQYDCDGHQVTTITLDEAIECDGEMISKFKFGNAGRGHLEGYRLVGM